MSKDNLINEEMKNEQKKEYQPPRFLEVVLSVGAGALQALGIALSDKSDAMHEPNLELARYSIDMLELLKEKTRGNLEEEEEKFLEKMLHELRLKYVEIANQPKEAK